MLKELREIVNFVLNFLNDAFELIRNSQLSASPIQNLGRDRAIALQLTGVIGIVITAIFIHALGAEESKVDISLFGGITVAYFAIAAFVINFLVRYLGDKARKKDKNATDFQIDSTSYVICFNLIALAIFAIVRSVLVFKHLNYIAVPALFSAAMAVGLMLVSGHRNASSNLTIAQKTSIVLMLAASFLAYAKVITSIGTVA